MEVRSLLERLVAVLVTFALMVTALVALPATSAEAADARDFDPGNIISDALFFDSGAMTANEVQAFLDAKGAGCTAGDPACLKDYVATTVARSADAYCNGYAGGQRQSAAQIIVGVAQSCGISPRVLLVLLEKEQSLVTRSRPTAYAYERATGFGCPDTAPCNTEYFGLHNQLFLAARQYQRYAANPTSYNHRAGRTSQVQYHPTASCGSSAVYMANQATAGLYNYTPYQPDAAALANLYGTGGSCSSYGNRNFWRLWTDWFGSTQSAGLLLRTTSNATVYLVSGTTKYPIASYDVLNAWSAAGPVGYVSQAYLDRRTTGPTLGRVVISEAGTVLLVDSGQAYTFTTCTQVADFGSSCAAATQYPVDQLVLDRLADGGVLRPTITTTDGQLFYLSGGVRREAVDTQALQAAGLSTTSVALTAGAIASVPYGPPVLRTGVRVRDRQTSADYLSAAAGLHPAEPAVLTATPLSAWQQRYLDSASIAKVTTLAKVGAFVQDASGTRWLLRGADRVALPASSSAVPASVPTVGTDVLAAVPAAAGTVGEPAFVQAAGGPVSYLLEAGTRRAVRSTQEAVLLNGGTAPTVHTVAAGLLATLPVGRDAALTQFSDVRLTSPFAEDILWLADSGIAEGYTDGTFRPTAAVSRQAMAAFLYRAAGSPAFTPPAAPTFADVGTGHQFYSAVEWLAAEGIATGWQEADGSLRFRPTTSVSRQAMAAFMHRAAGSPAIGLPATPSFVDVPFSNEFAASIEWLAAEGISTGTALPSGGAAFAPTDPVSRQAMAAFLHRAAG